jgi:hypothetical protein
VGNEKAPGDYRGREGTIIECGPGKGEYTVEIDGKKTFLNSWWLDPVEEKGGCEHPEKLKGKPEECTPEQIGECHGEVVEHPCHEEG